MWNPLTWRESEASVPIVAGRKAKRGVPAKKYIPWKKKDCVRRFMVHGWVESVAAC